MLQLQNNFWTLVMNWIVSSSRGICWNSSPPVPHHVTIVGDGAFEEGMEGRLVGGSESSLTGGLRRGGSVDTQRREGGTHSEEAIWRPWDVKGRHVERFFLHVSQRRLNIPAPWSQTWSLQNRDKTSVVFRLRVCDTVLWQPQKTNTAPKLTSAGSGLQKCSNC